MRTSSTKTAVISTAALYHFMLLSLVAIAIYVISTSAAFAIAGTNSPMGSVLCYVVSLVYGNLGRGLATLAVVIIGIGATLGKVSWGLAITVGIGIAVVFNANLIADAFINASGAGAIGC